MTKTLDDFRATFTPAQREAIDARAAELIAEEMTLRDLRQARKLTQERMAEMLGMEQENVSRLERRTDLLLSTLKSYVAAMGGNLKLVAEFPDRPSVTLTNYSDLADGEWPKARRGRGKRTEAITGH
ncbi:helix-turn-helix domain-containing protein [Sphingobium scionense]|jgi:DNA-binding XRE family transcriptional regulator|uniref:XRE family transcriptional regulator n=2 Tax=Sphingobium TaxID=165695 RepID=A0A6P1GD56_SPHYA|nr:MULTISPECIES: XRE family transcriptional regulator [Sphingobium]MBB4152024.1 DNA-binding XRE family transcriptional regulator [Sphingobium scionense]QHD66446.1 XRE family transcriptional regulator [Sphingobium yanoikuyae]QJR02134.1 XRE family transcriptional regulator [Sphingobium yanoikuyae]QNG48191.1 XRE family transcriptional regulator [Sphingobium yanoikuyae]